MPSIFYHDTNGMVFRESFYLYNRVPVPSISSPRLCSNPKGSEETLAYFSMSFPPSSPTSLLLKRPFHDLEPLFIHRARSTYPSRPFVKMPSYLSADMPNAKRVVGGTDHLSFFFVMGSAVFLPRKPEEKRKVAADGPVNRDSSSPVAQSLLHRWRCLR